MASERSSLGTGDEGRIDDRQDDRRLAELVAVYVDRLSAGESIDDQRLLAEEPHLGPQIVKRLRTFERLNGSSPTPPARGRLGDYTLRREVGRGGMGVVYEAWQNSVDRRVAVKVLPPGFAADTKAMTRFVREAKTAARLSHANIVPVYGMGVETDTPYYSMEYVEGQTLAQVLTTIREAVPGAETEFGPKNDLRFYRSIAAAFADVSDGLQHAHSKGVVHRDIKPSNIVLDPELDGRVNLEAGGGSAKADDAGSHGCRLRVLDFGLARLEGQESLTITGEIVGTPSYMSPEQAQAKRIPIDHRTDVYSVGAVMYETVTGHPPFHGKNHADTLSQITEREPTSPSRLSPGIPKDLETIVLKCLCKSARDRYGTAEALTQDLQRFVRGDVIEARPPSRFDAMRRRFVQNRMRVTLIALSLAVFVLGATTLLSFWRQAVQERDWRYDRLLVEGMAGLEIGFESVPGELDEGEKLSLGLADSFRLSGWFGERVPQTSIHESAVARLEEAAEVRPDRPEAWLHLSRGWLTLGEEDAALSALDHALQSSPFFIPALVHKARHVGRAVEGDATRDSFETLLRGVDARWQRLWIESHLTALESNWEELERLCGELLDQSATVEPYRGFRFEHLLKRGRVRVRLGRHLAALEDFLEARRMAPDVIATHLLVAEQYYQLEAPEEARRTLEETLAGFSAPNDALAVLDVCLQRGDKEYALSLVASLPSSTRLRMEATFLHRAGRHREAIESGRVALEAGTREPAIYVAMAFSSIERQRIDQAEQLLRQGLQEFPGDRALTALLDGPVAYRRGRLEELLARVRRKPKDRRALIASAWCHYRLGETQEALASLDRAIARSPRNGGIYDARAFIRSRTNDMDGAVSDAVEALALFRGRGGRTLSEIYALSTKEDFAGHWDRLSETFQLAANRGVIRSRGLGFHALAALYRRQPDLDEALELARAAVDRSPLSYRAEAFSRLAEVHFARGELSEAVRAVESGLECGQRHRGLSEQLTTYRIALFPRMASCRSVDAFVDRLALAPRSHAFREVRESLTLQDPHLTAYLEARLLEQAGNVVAAGKQLETLLDEFDLEDEAAHVRLAKVLMKAGRGDEALACLERYVLKHPKESLVVWETWLATATADRTWSAEALLRRPILAAEHKSASAREVERILNKLREDGALRLNCGRGRYEDSEGRIWERGDGFADGGRSDWRFFPPIEGTEDPWLFASLRFFFQDYWLKPGYRIPLPCGEYDVSLYFLETGLNPHPCRFDIELEGKIVEAAYEPLSAGMRVAHTKTYRVEVDDGSLNIVLRPANWLASVSAIEIRPSDDGVQAGK